MQNTNFIFKKRKELLSFSTTQRDLEDIKPSEIRQTEKDKHCMSSHVEIFFNNEHMEIENRLMVTRGGGWGGRNG